MSRILSSVIEAIVENQAGKDSTGPICRAAGRFDLLGSRHRYGNPSDDAWTGRGLSVAVFGERARPGASGWRDTWSAAGHGDRRFLRGLGAIWRAAGRAGPAAGRRAGSPGRPLRTCAGRGVGGVFAAEPIDKPWRISGDVSGADKLAGGTAAGPDTVAIAPSSVCGSDSPGNGGGDCAKDGRRANPGIHTRTGTSR